MLAAPAPGHAPDAAAVSPRAHISLGERLQALLGADALQPVSPTLTRIAVPTERLTAINDTLGQEGRLACWRAP